jgi:hypothetical protein
MTETLYDGFIDFLVKENAAKGVQRSNSKGPAEAKTSNTIAVTEAQQNKTIESTVPISLRDVEDNFGELYRLKEKNLATEIKLNQTALEINRLQMVIAEVKQEDNISALKSAATGLNNQQTALSKKPEILKSFQDLKFSTEQEVLKDQYSTIQHLKNQETRYQRGELSQNKLNEREKFLDTTRADVRQLKSHAVKNIAKLEKERVVVIQEKDSIEKKAAEQHLPTEITEQLAALESRAAKLTKEIEKNEAIVVTIDKAMTNEEVLTMVQQPQHAAKVIEQQQVEITESSKVETVIPEIAEKQQKLKEEPSSKEKQPPHVYANVIVNNSTVDPKLEPEFNPELKPETKTDREEPDSGIAQIPTDLTPKLKQAVIENLEAKKELSALTIEKKTQLLEEIKKNKELKSKIPGLKEEIAEEQKLLENITKDLEDPGKLVATIKEKIGHDPEFPKDMEKIIETIETDTQTIKEHTDKLKEMTLPELKEALFPNSSKFKWFRRLLNLWPLATYPLCIMWAAMIMPAPVFLIYGGPLALTAFAGLCISYFLPKAINKVREILAERRAKKEAELGQEPEIAQDQTKEQTQEKSQEQAKGRTEITKEQAREGKPEIAKSENQSQMKEKTLSPQSSSPSLAADARESRGQSEEIQPSAEQNPLENQIEGETSIRAKLLDFLKKNWKTVAIIVGVSLLVGVAAIFLMPAVAPMLAGSVAIGGAFTIGTMALIGAAVSIGAQLIDHFGLKRVQNNLANKEKEKINGLEKNSHDEIRKYEQDKSKTVEENLLHSIKEAAGQTKNQPEIKQPERDQQTQNQNHMQSQTSSVRATETRQTESVKSSLSSQSSEVTKIVPLNQTTQPQQSASAAQLQQTSAAQQPFAVIAKRGQADAEVTNRRKSESPQRVTPPVSLKRTNSL